MARLDEAVVFPRTGDEFRGHVPVVERAVEFLALGNGNARIGLAIQSRSGCEYME